MVTRATVALVFIVSLQAFAQDSRDNLKNEAWRKPLVRGGYPIKKFPKALISGEKPVKRDIGGKKNLTLEEFNKIMDRKVEEFYQRMRSEVKENKREARLEKKPQYSDQSYFGHKRKPKKRRIGKRKMCKECGIVH